jgi:hypothetical protein
MFPDEPISAEGKSMTYPTFRSQRKESSAEIKIVSYDDVSPRSPEFEELYQSLTDLIDLLEQHIEDVTAHQSSKLRVHVTREHEETRTQLWKATETSTLTILDFLHVNAPRNIQIVSFTAMLLSLFSLAVSAAMGIHILNPFVAMLTAVASIGFYIMGWVLRKERHVESGSRS